MLLLVGFAAANLLAYRHAYALTHYAPAGGPSPRPEGLSARDRLRLLVGGVSVPRPKADRYPEAVGLRYTSHTLDLGDERLALWHVDAPSPRGVVVLGHGYGCSKSHLLPEAVAFHKLGWAVVLADFRGSGGSSGSAVTLGVTEAADLAAAAKWAGDRHPGKPLVLYGFSMGAVAAVRATAGSDASPAGLILDAPFDSLLSAVQVRCDAVRAPRWPAAELLVFWGGRQHGFDGFALRPADDAARVPCPALVFHGSADPRATPEMVRRVYAPLPGRKSLVTIEGVGHTPIAHAAPDRWAEAVGPFLDEIAKSVK
ncbi:MAG: alpha/beta fold hydrolase [Gemmataceae bacterium]